MVLILTPTHRFQHFKSQIKFKYNTSHIIWTLIFIYAIFNTFYLMYSFVFIEWMLIWWSFNIRWYFFKCKISKDHDSPQLSFFSLISVYCHNSYWANTGEWFPYLLHEFEFQNYTSRLVVLPSRVSSTLLSTTEEMGKMDSCLS